MPAIVIDSGAVEHAVANPGHLSDVRKNRSRLYRVIKP